mmetsp:Transcript_10532/g.17925  ORF Transcript_10532/g.17925 Transcript_10532/m.17925 type:complete len:846 (+) Transcript_10532:26-2563(+)
MMCNLLIFLFLMLFTEPTSSPSTSNIPSEVPTLNPSRSSIPSTSPSNHPITPVLVTFAPTAIADVPSSVPMNAAPTNSESGSEGSSTAPSHGDFLSPSSMPSELPPGAAIDVDAKPPLNGTEDHDSFSRDTIIVAAALVLTLVIAGSLYTVYNRPPRTVTTKETCADPTHDIWESTMSSVPHACLGINQSISSSSCSFRDDRFINVFSSEGSPIPQFNPSTANIVVIGTVSIGSSSFSSDFPRSGADYLANDCGLESPSSRSCRRSFRLNARKKARFRHRYVKSQTLSRGHDHGFLPPSPRSVHSSKTMPMTLSCGRKLHSQDPSDDGNISLCDWKAVSYMSSEFYCGSSATGAAAAAAHKNFFFDLFTADNTLESVSCHSLPVIPRQFSFASSESDVGVSSVLCKSSFVHVCCTYIDISCSNSMSAESFFKAESSYSQNQSIAISLQSPSSNTGRTPSNVLIPWRKGGFSQEMEFSDSNRSESSDSSVTYVALPLRNKRGIFGPSKRLFAAFRKKTKAKFSLRSKQYQHLRGVELHEDPSILSMSNSYLSETNLTAEQQRQTPTKPPKVFLGTFAAAAMPFSPDSGLSLGAGHEPTLGALSASNASSYFDQTDVVDLEANEVIQGEKSDSASAFSRSQFESSKGWSSCSCLSSDSSSDSSSAGSQWHNGNLDCSFAEAIAIDGVLSDTTCPDTLMEDKTDLSQIISESESSEAFEVSDSSEVPEEEESHESFIGTIQDLSRDSLALSSSEDDSGYNTSLLPHLVSYSSEDLSFPSDELSPLNGLIALKRPQLQRANIVSNGDDDACSAETDRSNTGLSSDECATNVIEWAIKNETKKLEGNIPL